MPRVRLVYADRLAALTPRQRAGQIRYGRARWGLWERTPDVVARWTMLDPNLSAEAARTVAVIFSSAYAALAGTPGSSET